MGIKEEIDGDQLFTIEVDKKDMCTGIGMKRAFFTLGYKMTIVSNRNENTRVFYIYPKDDNSKLIYDEPAKCKIKEEIKEGTKIIIEDLYKDIKDKIDSRNFCKNLVSELGYIYRYIISKELLQITIKDKNNKSYNVEFEDIDGELIDSIEIEGIKYELYKTNKDSDGIEIFEKGIMKYDKEECKNTINSKKRNETGHSYKKALIIMHSELDNIENYIKDKKQTIQDNIDEIKTKNRNHFSNSKTSIKFEKPYSQVQELRKYYSAESNGELGEKGYEKLLNEYNGEKVVKNGEVWIRFSKPYSEVESLKSYYGFKDSKEIGEEGYEKILTEYRNSCNSDKNI